LTDAKRIALCQTPLWKTAELMLFSEDGIRVRKLSEQEKDLALLPTPLLYATRRIQKTAELMLFSGCGIRVRRLSEQEKDLARRATVSKIPFPPVPQHDVIPWIY